MILPVSATPKPSETYLNLRKQALGFKREEIGLPAPAQSTEPWGVIMDWPVGNGTATVVAISDGTASIYLSSGGGYIGGQGHESIRKAAQKAVSVAASSQTQMQPVTADSRFPLPQKDELIFYALTDAGVFASTVPESGLRNGSHPLTKLGGALQEVITQYCLIQPKR